jgi:hypothetical protein
MPPSAPDDGPPALDKKRFAGLQGTMPEAAFSYFLYCHLLDVEFHLEEIARARAALDFPRLSDKAQTVAGMAVQLGAMRTAAAASRLDLASRAQRPGDTARLIAELQACCMECEAMLRRFLVRRSRAAGWSGSA